MTAKLLLWLVAILLLISADNVHATSDCDMQCADLPLVPPRWEHGGKDIPNLAQMCVIRQQCQLDIDDLLKNMSVQNKPGHGLKTYISIDLLFTCSSNFSLGTYVANGLA